MDLPNRNSIKSSSVAQRLPSPSATKKQGDNRWQWHTVNFVLVFILLLCVLLAVLKGTQLFSFLPQVPRNQDTAPYAGVLTAEEQKNWQEKPVIKGAVTLQLNLLIPVTDEGVAEIRLINPPYSYFACEAKLTLAGDEGQVLYQSGRLNPGSVVLRAKLDAALTAGQQDAIVTYSFYDGLGTPQGTYTVAVVLQGQG